MEKMLPWFLPPRCMVRRTASPPLAHIVTDDDDSQITLKTQKQSLVAILNGGGQMIQTETSGGGASFLLPSTLGSEIGACGDSVAFQSTAWGDNPHACLGGQIADNDPAVSSLSLSCNGVAIPVENLSLGLIGISIPSDSAFQAASAAETSASDASVWLNCSDDNTQNASLWCSSTLSQHTVSCEDAPKLSSIIYECPNVTAIAICEFWDGTTQAWSTEGCAPIGSGIGSNGNVECECSHLTDFLGQGKLIVGNAKRTLLYTAELDETSFAAAREVLFGLAVLYGVFGLSVALNVYRDRGEQRARLIRLLGSEALQKNIDCLREPLVQDYIHAVLEAAAASGAGVEDEASVAARVAVDEQARHVKSNWLTHARRRLWARDLEVERAFAPNAPNNHHRSRKSFIGSSGRTSMEPVLSLTEWEAAQMKEEDDPAGAAAKAGCRQQLRERLARIELEQKGAALVEAEQIQREKSKGHDELVKRLRSAELRKGNGKRGLCGRWAGALREEHGLLAIVTPRQPQQSEHLDDIQRVTGMQRSFLFLTSFLTLLFMACLAFDPEEDYCASFSCARHVYTTHVFHIVPLALVRRG